MPTLSDGSIGQDHSDNNLDTPSLTTIDLGENTVSSLELSVDFDNSEISLTIVHKPALDQPVMTTRTRSASFSDSEHTLESLSLEENSSDSADSEHFPESVPAAEMVLKSDSNDGEEETGNRKDKEKGPGPECQQSSQESPASSDEYDTTEPLAATLVRRAFFNTFDVKVEKEEAKTPPPPPSQPPANKKGHMKSVAKFPKLCFFKAPEPSYVLYENEDGVTVNLTNDVTLKFFSAASEEIEDALEKLPTIAPKLRSLIENAEGQLSQAVHCLMWDLSGKKFDRVPEPQEMEDESQEMEDESAKGYVSPTPTTATLFELTLWIGIKGLLLQIWTLR
ncbi:hypothetical protein B9Z19DRAFT_1068772 [Tuber borchii]|uniref:Uncharacterized protein n=1 Tax=Tuber borchii TaxID=42251 RepID=A0A2T6ZE89_TUBBO|nr:hypothetical protein B9Z19DRAFT_1068772 [Tuber borchii]